MTDQSLELVHEEDAVCESPVMVGGCGSSGTTLLRTLLDRHPDLVCGHELSVLNKRTLYDLPFAAHRHRIGEYMVQGLATEAVLEGETLPTSTAWQPRREMRFIEKPENYHLSLQAVAEVARGSGTWRQFVNELFTPVLTQSGAARWVEKTPTNCYCIGRFLELYENGKYIHVVRDGRDVVLSLTRRGWSIESAVRRWLYDTSTGLPFRAHPRCQLLRYEDLVAHPESVMTRLLEWLELPDSETVTRSHSDSGAEDASGHQGWGVHSTWTAHPDGEITTDAIGKWTKADATWLAYAAELFRRIWLSPRVVHALGLRFELNSVQLLDRLGYDSSSMSRGGPIGSRRYYRHLASEWRQPLALSSDRPRYFRMSGLG